MGLAYARVKLANPRLPDLEPVEVEALADTGSVHLWIPSIAGSIATGVRHPRHRA